MASVWAVIWMGMGLLSGFVVESGLAPLQGTPIEEISISERLEEISRTNTFLQQSL